MTSFLRLDSGEPLDAAGLRALSADGTLALRVVQDAAPLRDGQIVHLRRVQSGERRRLGLAITADGDVVAAWRPAPTAVARVSAIQRGPTRLQLDRPVLHWVPARWLPRLADGLEVAGRLVRPLSPPLFLGSPHACMDAVRAKYSAAPEVQRYAALAGGELEQAELDLIASAVGRGGRLLDVGCGAGREAIGLAREGYQVVGVDISPAMIAAAREAARRAGRLIDFRVQSLTDLDDPPGTYDGVYIAAALHHVPGRARRVDALRRVRRALAPGGALIVFVVYRWPRPLLSRSRLVDALRRVAARMPFRVPVSEPGDGYMREVSEASDPRAPIFFHDYAGPSEVRDELEAAGFTAREAHRGWWTCRRDDDAGHARCGWPGASARIGRSRSGA